MIHHYAKELCATVYQCCGGLLPTITKNVEYSSVALLAPVHTALMWHDDYVCVINRLSVFYTVTIENRVNINDFNINNSSLPMALSILY